MSNMSYCRFENTVNDLKDCYDHMDEIDDMSEHETKARERLLLLCKQISDDYDLDIEDIIEAKQKRLAERRKVEAEIVGAYVIELPKETN